MKIQILFSFTLIASFLIPSRATADDKKNATPVSWGYAAHGPIDVRPSLMNRLSPVLHLERGALVTVLVGKSRKGGATTRVRAINPATLDAVIGNVDTSLIEIEPLDRYPSDAELLKQLGGIYLDDFTASNVQIARYVLRQGKQDPALVCFLGSRMLSQARLQAFQIFQGKFVPGPFLGFPMSEIQSAITSLDVRDLVGDGNECLVTHEPFKIQPENEGVNLVIRRIENKTLITLWHAPLQFRNMASFPSERQVLKPPEENIGAAGTVATGTVEYRARGAMSEPLWKGKISFYVVGRQDALDSATIEKLCPWDGSKFAPLTTSR